jgi:hypothetical protein
MYWTPITVLPITASAGGDTWSLNIPFTSGQIGLELPCGTTDVSTIGLVQTRFPIQYPGGFPINYPPVTQYSFGWGVNYANSVGFSAIPNGAIVTFSDVSLISETNASKQSAITFLETFLDFVTGWTSPTDTTTVQPFMILEADGKIIDMPGMALVTPSSGMSPPTYTFYTIAQMVTMYAYFPGLTISTLPDPSDGYHGSGLLAFLLGGSGDTYNWSTNQWTDWVDVNLPQTTIPAQDLWDEIQIYPGCGNPWGGTRSFGSPTPLRASKSLRGQANGLIYNTPGNLFSGVKVKVFETSSPTIGEGSGISDAIGKYYTLTPWLFGNVNSETQVQLPPNYYQTGVVQNRQRRRTSFRVQPVTLKNLDYDVSLQFRHGRVSANATTGTLWMGVSPNGDPYAWVDIDTGIPSTQGAVRWQDNGNVPFGILYAQPSSSNLLWVQTPDEGNTFTMATTISSTLATNGFFDFEECADFLRWFWWLEGSSAPYTIYVKCLDPQLNVIIPRTATNVTNSDLAEIRVKEYPQTGGARKFGLQYAVSGSVVFLTSPDGITWT